MNIPQPHLHPNQLFSTAQVATLLGIAKETVRSRKSRSKGLLIEDTHWKQQDGGTLWTTAGLFTLAEWTSTPQAKQVLVQIAKASQQATPLALAVDRTEVTHLEAYPIANGSLSDDEQQAFVEALDGKLPEPQIHNLLQRMQELDPASEQPQEENITPLPVQHRLMNSPLFIAASVVAALTLGGAGLWLSRISATSAATHSEISDRPEALQSNPGVGVAAREGAIAQSLTLANQQQEAIDLLRRDYLLTQAERDRKSTGISVDQWLIRHLNKQVEELQRSASDNSGSAKQIAIARSITGETKATLLALRSNKTPITSYSAAAGLLERSLRQFTPVKEATSNGVHGSNHEEDPSLY